MKIICISSLLRFFNYLSFLSWFVAQYNSWNTKLDGVSAIWEVSKFLLDVLKARPCFLQGIDSMHRITCSGIGCPGVFACPCISE